MWNDRSHIATIYSVIRHEEQAEKITSVVAVCVRVIK